MTAAAEPRRTFLLIQALRGLAALWVVLFHIGMGQYVVFLTRALPRWIGFIVFDYGLSGVAVFFVLSGFVISHSLSGKAMGGRGFLRFVARRSIRLDPPYWASMALTVAAGALYARAKGLAIDLPGVGTVIGHGFYLQELLHLPEIGIVYWTLTYEIQFYLVLSAACWAVTMLVARGMPAGRAQLLAMLPLGALAFASAAIAEEWAIHGLFVNLWHGFFLGVLAYEAGVRRRWAPALVALAAVTLAGAWRVDAIFGTPCAITALLLWAAARSGHLDRGLGAAPWQFLGRISYSLYLVHPAAILIGYSLWDRIVGRGLVLDLLGLIIVGGGVVAASALFWWCFERPAHALSARLFRGKAEPALAARL